MNETIKLINPREALRGIGEGIAGIFRRIQAILSSSSGKSEQKVSHVDKLIGQFDYIETVPVRFEKDKDDLFAFWIESAGPLLENNQDPDGRLRQRVIALQYRLEKENGGFSPGEVSNDIVDELRGYAVEWKRTHPLVTQVSISPREEVHLKNASRYPLFIDLIRNYSGIRGEFLNWVLRDENDVSPFIQFPASVGRLLLCGLSGRISRFGGGKLKIMRTALSIDGVEQKDLTLPFEGHDQSILDPSLPIQFRGGYQLPIADVFNIFAHKDTEVGNLEFMADGIVNWNIHQLGYWDVEKGDYVRVDLGNRRWWEQMPIFELLTRRQIWQRYRVALKPHQWVAAACATRGKPNLDYEETHAYLEIAIPRGRGVYALYDFGKLALEYPKNLFEKLWIFTKNVHATVAYPDDNVYYTHRQTAFRPFALNASQGLELMDGLKEDIITTRTMNLVYQIESENCAKWVHQKLEGVVGSEKMPDLFRMQLLDTEPQGPIAHLFRWIKQLPARWQVPVLAHLHLPLGAFRKIWIIEEGRKVAKSLSSHPFFETGQIYLPALLVKKVLAASLSAASAFIGTVRGSMPQNVVAIFCAIKRWRVEFKYVFDKFSRICQLSLQLLVLNDLSAGSTVWKSRRPLYALSYRVMT